MAATKEILKKDMKTTLNYGEIEGKLFKKSKTYGDVRHDVTSDAFLATAEAIGRLQEPLLEGQNLITTEDVFAA